MTQFITCDPASSKKITPASVVKFVGLALFQCWKQVMSKEVDNDFSVVSGNYESEVPSKKTNFSGSFTY